MGEPSTNHLEQSLDGLSEAVKAQTVELRALRVDVTQTRVAMEYLQKESDSHARNIRTLFEKVNAGQIQSAQIKPGMDNLKTMLLMLWGLLAPLIGYAAKAFFG